jgi:hypothetical protein
LQDSLVAREIYSLVLKEKDKVSFPKYFL